MSKRKQSLSRAEWMVLLGLFLLLLSLVLPTAWSYRMNAVDRMTRADFGKIEGGVKYFIKYYNRMPTDLSVTYDFRFGLPDDLPNRHVINALRGVEGEGNQDHAVNPDKNVFSDFGYAGPNQSGLSAAGDLLDAWGQPYQIVLDMDGNRICDLVDSIYDRAFGKQIAIWSYGADGRANSEDDILSWAK